MAARDRVTAGHVAAAAILGIAGGIGARARAAQLRRFAFVTARAAVTFIGVQIERLIDVAVAIVVLLVADLVHHRRRHALEVAVDTLVRSGLALAWNRSRALVAETGDL